jgi:hypothetical protein
MVAQKIAGRYLRDTVTVDNLFGLRAFPGPRGPRRITGPICLPIFCAVSLADLLAIEMASLKTSCQLSAVSSQEKQNLRSPY